MAMSVVGFRAKNHPQQVGVNGANDDVDDRGTRAEYFDAWDKRFGGFTLDVAAAAHNAKCQAFFDREMDGLKQSWAGERVWCNPPYSNLKGEDGWLAKAWREWPTTRGIVMLLPANRTEQSWWQDYVEPYRDGRGGNTLSVEFLPGRMRFDRRVPLTDPRGDRPPFGLCLLIWKDPTPHMQGVADTTEDERVAVNTPADQHSAVGRGFQVETESFREGWQAARDAALATMKRGYPLLDGESALEMMRTLNEGVAETPAMGGNDDE